MNADNLTVLLLVALLAFGLGAVLSYLLLFRKNNELKNDTIRLQAELDVEQRTAAERANALNQAKEQLGASFTALASEALKHNTGEFLKLAQENLKQFQIQAKGELDQKEKAVENLVKPIKEALQKTEQQIHAMEKERQAAYGSLSKHLETMAQTQRSLQNETRNLVNALRRPEVRGQWGEMTLKRLAELAGMVEHCDFAEQVQVKTDEGVLRPDMMVRMPDGRNIVVDAKTPLDAYITAVEKDNPEERQQALERHARQLRERVRELAGKAYWKQFANTPDFVVLFIPGDQFLSAALDIDKGLLEEALANKVILATPTSFVALLRAVAYGWRQQSLAENAEKIRQVGEELYGRLVTFSEHLGKVGKSLETGVAHYNKAIGSFDSRIMPSVRKFSEMGIEKPKEVASHAPIEKAVRNLIEPDSKDD